MDVTWLHVGGLSIRAPVTTGTNLVLAIQCVVYWLALKDRPSSTTRSWGMFFLMMSVTALAGSAKHGARHAIADDTYLAVLWVTNVGSALATFFGQRAAYGGVGRLGCWLPKTQLLAFLAAHTLFGPDMLVVVVNSAAGLGPIMVLEAVRGLRGRAGSLLISVGIAISTATAAVYLTQLSLGAGLNHIDIAHVLMGVSLWLMLVGVRRAAGGTPWS